MTLAELSRLRSRVEHEYSSKRAIWRRPSIYWPARPTRPERQARSSRRSNIGSADVRRAKAPPSSAATLAHRGARHRRVDRDRRRDCGRACRAGRAGGTRGTPEGIGWTRSHPASPSGPQHRVTSSRRNTSPTPLSSILGVRRRPPRLPSVRGNHGATRLLSPTCERPIPGPLRACSGRDPGAWRRHDRHWDRSCICRRAAAMPRLRRSIHCATATAPVKADGHRRGSSPVRFFRTAHEGTTKRPANHSAASAFASNARASW
jgi:hypothetical protein